MILSHITKRYRGTTALDDLSLAIEEGQITAVLGESGAGKTTLLNCIMGLIPFEGEIDGQCFPKAKRREGCSYLFQDALLLPNLTAEENIRFVLPKEAGDRAREMLARVGLRGKETSYPHELSGGEKQRVSIARAFLYPHQLLLMDEPFSSLDLALKRTLMELVRTLRDEEGGTVLFVTHDVREAAFLAQRALVLRHGKLIGELAIDAPYPRDLLSPPPEAKELARILLEAGEIK